MPAKSDANELRSVKRRDFLFVATGTITAIATALATWHLIDSMNADAAVLSFTATEAKLHI